MNYLQNKIILITGASSGIGRALAEALDSFGAKLVLVARRTALLEELASSLICESHIIQADLLDNTSLQTLVQNTVQHFGRLDILINNAGMGGKQGLVTEMPDDELSCMIDLNLKAPMLLSKHAIAQFTEQGGGGTILMMNSIAGKHAYPYWAAYAATKAGLLAFSDALSEEQRCNNTRIITIYPGACHTAIWDEQDLPDDPNIHHTGLLTPQDVASACVYALNTPPHLLISDITLQPTRPCL